MRIHCSPECFISDIGIALDQDLMVAQVLAGSRAEKAGIRKGDVFKGVGSSRVNSVEDARKVAREEIGKVTTVVNDSLSTQDIVVTLGRGSAEITIVMRPVSPPFNFDSAKATPVPAPPSWVFI
ncbi:MAG TPA: hypothetical protein VH186_29875 [Chloroflexia bacterium]|nr:hypothetical protein [Chloroflexia bacterium]